MRRLGVVAWILAIVLVVAPTVSLVSAEDMGTATMSFNVDPGMDPATVEQTILDNVQIVGPDGNVLSGAEVSVTVENGVATVTASNVPVGTTVQAALPAQVASSIGATAVGTLAGTSVAGAGTGLGTGAAIGAGTLIAVGVGVGTWVALDDDDEAGMSPDGSTTSP